MALFCYFRLYLGIETDSFCLLQGMARMEVDDTWKSWATVFKF